MINFSCLEDRHLTTDIAIVPWPVVDRTVPWSGARARNKWIVYSDGSHAGGDWPARASRRAIGRRHDGWEALLSARWDNGCGAREQWRHERVLCRAEATIAGVDQDRARSDVTILFYFRHLFLVWRFSTNNRTPWNKYISVDWDGYGKHFWAIVLRFDVSWKIIGRHDWYKYIIGDWNGCGTKCLDICFKIWRF